MPRKSKVYESTDDEFKQIVQQSINFSDCCRKIGLSINGNNGRAKIKQRCEELNISYQHLYLSNIEVHSHPVYSIEEILVENSTYASRTKLKQRLVSEGLMEYKCSICGNQGEWNGHSLTLQLDHINGINNDNRLENLRFLCPNCHSQTDTFSGKNKTTSS